jgi:hypothetical protein
MLGVVFVALQKVGTQIDLLDYHRGIGEKAKRLKENKIKFKVYLNSRFHYKDLNRPHNYKAQTKEGTNLQQNNDTQQDNK